MEIKPALPSCYRSWGFNACCDTGLGCGVKDKLMSALLYGLFCFNVTVQFMQRIIIEAHYLHTYVMNVTGNKTVICISIGKKFILKKYYNSFWVIVRKMFLFLNKWMSGIHIPYKECNKIFNASVTQTLTS